MKFRATLPSRSDLIGAIVLLSNDCANVLCVSYLEHNGKPKHVSRIARENPAIRDEMSRNCSRGIYGRQRKSTYVHEYAFTSVSFPSSSRGHVKMTSSTKQSHREWKMNSSCGKICFLTDKKYDDIKKTKKEFYNFIYDIAWCYYYLCWKDVEKSRLQLQIFKFSNFIRQISVTESETNLNRNSSHLNLI